MSEPVARVLVADDEPSIRYVLREALGEAGHEVVEVESGDAAKVLGEHADPIRAVGDGRRHPEEEEQRQDQERPASGDNVERAGDHAGGSEYGQFKPGGHVLPL